MSPCGCIDRPSLKYPKQPWIPGISYFSLPRVYFSPPKRYNLRLYFKTNKNCPVKHKINPWRDVIWHVTSLWARAITDLSAVLSFSTALVMEAESFQDHGHCWPRSPSLSCCVTFSSSFSSLGLYFSGCQGVFQLFCSVSLRRVWMYFSTPTFKRLHSDL